MSSGEDATVIHRLRVNFGQKKKGGKIRRERKLLRRRPHFRCDQKQLHDVFHPCDSRQRRAGSIRLTIGEDSEWPVRYRPSTERRADPFVRSQKADENKTNQSEREGGRVSCESLRSARQLTLFSPQKRITLAWGEYVRRLRVIFSEGGELQKEEKKEEHMSGERRSCTWLFPKGKRPA